MEGLKKILLAGAGAVGLTVAHKLIANDSLEFKILARNNRFERYKKDGLFVNGKKLQVEFANPDKKDSHWIPDLIIIASKNHHLDCILEDIKCYVGMNTIIISLLNGITSEKIIEDKYGKNRCPLAMILGTDAYHENNHTHFKNEGTIFFGEKKNPKEKPYSKKVTLIFELFKKCSIDFFIPEDMEQKLWFKFMCNVGINQSSAILKLPYGAFQKKESKARILMIEAMKEVIPLAKKENISLSSSDIKEWLSCLHTLNPEGKTSMCQDVCAKRKTEVELFAKTIVALGEKHAIKTPINKTFYLQLCTIENNYT